MAAKRAVETCERSTISVNVNQPKGLVKAHDSVVLSRTVTTSSTSALEHVRSTGPCRNELRQAALGIVALLLALGRVDDEDDVGDRNRGFGDVGRKDDAPDSFRWGLEDGLLFGDGNGGVEKVDFVLAVGEVDVEKGVAVSVEEDVANGLDLVPSGKEDEDVALVRLADDPGDDEGDERVRHVEVVDFADGSSGALVDIDLGDEFAAVVGVDRLFAPDPASLRRREPESLQLANGVVQEMLVDGEAASWREQRESDLAERGWSAERKHSPGTSTTGARRPVSGSAK